MHAGADDDETGRSGYHVELPPGQRRVKNEQMEGTTARTGQPAVRHVAAVERAFAVLDALADGQELGTNEIARRTGINASTVSRLLATLAAARYVEHVPETGRYRLSLRLVELGNAVLGRLDLRALARPHLQALVRETGETATLSAPGEHDAVTVDFAHSSSAVQSVAQLGRPSVGHATAAGKVMLAFGDVELPAEPLASFTPRTIATRAELVAELERVRRRGYAEAQGRARGRARGGRGAGARQPRRARRASSACRGRRRASTPRAMRCRGSPLLVEHAGCTLGRAGSAPDGEASAVTACSGRQPDEAGRTLADPLRQLRVRAPLQPRRGRARRRAGPARARRRARAAPRSAAGCRAAAARPRPRARRASAAGARSASSTSSVPMYSYFIASEIGPSGTSAALTMISRCPDSTAASTASSVASGSKGTSKVTSITGRLPETPGISALVRLRRMPSTRYSGRSFQLFVLSRMRFDGQAPQLRDGEQRVAPSRARRGGTRTGCRRSTASGIRIAARTSGGPSTSSRYRRTPVSSTS